MQKRKRTDEAGEDVEAAAAFAFLPTDSESSESSESSDSENRSLLDRMLALPDEPEFTQYAQSFHDDAFDFQTSDSDSTSSSQLQTMLDALKELETTPAPHSSDDDDDDDAAQNPDRHASKKDRSKRMLIADSCRTLVSIMYNTKDDTVRRMFKQPPLKTVKEPWYRPSAWPLPSGDIPSEFMEGRYCDDPFEDEDLLHGGSTDTWGSNVDSELLMPKSILPSDFVQTKKQKDQPENNTSPQTGFGTPGLRREVALLMRELSLIPSNGGSNPSFSRSAHPADVDRVTQTIQNVFTSVADTYREKVIQSLQRSERKRKNRVTSLMRLVTWHDVLNAAHVAGLPLPVISRTRARLERFFSTASTYYDIQSDDTAGAKRSLRIPSEGPTAINGKSLVAEYLEGLHTSADFRRLQMSNGGQ